MNGGLSQEARTLADAQKGLYRDLLPEQRPTLRQLAESALAAETALEGVADQHFNACAERAYETRRAFLTELELATGIPAWMWRSLGESILP